ncbi:MAG: DUF5677 domain-containing protein [Bacillota bacterium]
MKKHMENYHKYLNESLLQKFSLNDFKHYDNMIESRNKYVDLFDDYRDSQEGVIVEPNSKENVFGYIFATSTHFFDELLNNIVLSSYDSAHFSIRRIVENYVILTFLLKNDQSISDFFKQVSMSRYKHVKSSETLRAHLKPEDIIKIEEEYREIREEIINHFGLETPLSGKKSDDLDKALRSNYYWAFREFDFAENISFKKLCDNIGSIEDYTSFSQSSNRVHSNNIMEYTLMMTSDYKEEMYLAYMYCRYIIKFVTKLKENYTTLQYSEISRVLIDLDTEIEDIYSKGL